MARQTKGQGSLFKDQRSPYWQIRFWDGSEQRRKSTQTTDRKEALEFLQEQLSIVHLHRGGTHRVTISTLIDVLLKEYREQNRKSLYTAELRIEKHVRPAFGKLRGAKLTTAHIREYKEKRLSAGASGSTINRELAYLRRSFNLGMLEDPPLVTRVPRIPALPEDNVREGFLEEPNYRAILDALVDSVKPVFIVAYHLGMRTGELLQIKREWVDLEDGVIYITGKVTKNKKPKTAPIYGEMRECLEAQLTRCQTLAPKTKELFVWQDGSPILDFRESWHNACVAAGLPDLLFHDLRRTAVRNMIRAGVPEKVAMEISGHKTAAMLWRYNITDIRDIIEAGQRTGRYLKKLKEARDEEAAKKETKE